jgi:hypothetical protein
MADKFYQFDYAEMNGGEVKNMGILNIACSNTLSKDLLKNLARTHLKNPDANIVISNVTKLTKSEFDMLTNSKTA